MDLVKVWCGSCQKEANHFEMGPDHTQLDVTCREGCQVFPGHYRCGDCGVSRNADVPIGVMLIWDVDELGM